MNVIKGSIVGAVLLGLAEPTAFGQSVGGVFGPVVNAGHKSAQIRLGFDPDSEQMATRVHYQQSLNDDILVRATVQTRKTNDSDLDLNFVDAIVFWQLPNIAAHWQTGVRIDARARSDGRPNAFNAHWMNQFALSDDLSLRAIVMTSKDVGADARDGIFVQTRTSLTYKLPNSIGIGAEFHNGYGSSGNFGNFDDQNHQFGIFANIPFEEKWSVYTGILTGVSDAAPDTNLKLWFSRKF